MCVWKDNGTWNFNYIMMLVPPQLLLQSQTQKEEVLHVKSTCKTFAKVSEHFFEDRVASLIPQVFFAN